MQQVHKYPGRPLIAILFSLLLLPLSVNASAPSVLVTLKPLHSLVSALMQDISEPELLMDDFQSPHDYSMKPSDRRRIHQADMVIYVSPDIESFMPSLDDSLQQKQVIRLIDIPGLKLLKARALDAHNSGQHHHIDGHIWLSIDNAIIISDYLTNEFIKIDSTNEKKYTLNNKTQLSRLKQLKADIQQKMLMLGHQPFLSFHDAFQYFEKEFKLSAGHFVTSSPEQQAGIRHITFLQKKIQQEKIYCVFYEPPHIPAIIKTITEGSLVKLIALEPLGIKFPAGNRQYFDLLRDISNNLYNCLKQDL